MPRRQSSTRSPRKPKARHALRVSLADALCSANRRAHEQANRRSQNRRHMKSVRAAIAAVDDRDDDILPLGFGTRVLRWLIALLLLPVCLITTWTLLVRFSDATLHQGFWQTPEFWYFATGSLIMIGWFWSGLLQSFFLYLYVLGHELTHVLFVLLCRGKVSAFHVSSSGGYITTNKTNLLIALSPYFVPFWSLVCATLYVSCHLLLTLHPYWHLVFYGCIGITWTFHMLYTLWMIPRDQPDLKENGTALSLVIIYLANLLVLIALLCAAEDQPLQYAIDFGREWFRNAAVSTDIALRWSLQSLNQLKQQFAF